jgi:uncharacterized coiled-coil protein SlyX
VENLLGEIEDSIEAISLVLGEEGSFSEKNDKLRKLLDEREKLLDKFGRLPLESDLTFYFRNNHNKWLDRINVILERDKKNLDIIEKNLKLLIEKIKDFNKQKSLMIYMKR